jgi:hypothetical protein
MSIDESETPADLDVSMAADHNKSISKRPASK